MINDKLVHKEDKIFVWDQILNTKHFLNYYQEFNCIHNHWDFSKLVSDTQALDRRDIVELPWFGGLAKPANSQGIGDNLNLLDLSSTLKVIAEHTLKVKLQLLRINTNIQFFGQETLLHQDAKSPGFWSFLIFFNPRWLAEHGGEFTLIRPDNTIFSSLPLPNRGILFDAELYHKGCAPNKFCGSPRFSAAFTYGVIPS